MTHKIAILIASHIGYKGQLNFFNKCLYSLINQTEHADIYASVSCESMFEKSLYENILTKYGEVKFLISNQRKTQFQHYHNILVYLLSLPSGIQHDFFMFIDDDDTYNANRVKIFTQKIYMAKRLYGFQNIKCYANIYRDEPEEFVRYCIHPDLLNDFFTKINKYDFIEKSYLCDCVFREYLSRLKNKYEFDEGIITYNYRHHTKSVCAV